MSSFITRTPAEIAHAAPTTCEHEPCSEAPALAECYSIPVGFAHHVRGQGHAYAACDAGQHYSCSHEHALQTTRTCILQHLPELPDLGPSPYRDCPLTICCLAKCQKPLDEGWNIPICYAMVGRDEYGKFRTPYVCSDEHWCCSIEHAQEAALACLDEHLHPGPHGISAPEAIKAQRESSS